MLQGLASRGSAPRHGLWLVTRGAQAIDGTLCQSLAQAPLWGLGRVAMLEYPELGYRQIDLDPGSDLDVQVELLIGQLIAADTDSELAIRNGRVLTRRLARQQPDRSVSFQPRGTWLISGGLGGLGLAVAQWLADNGVERLILASRHPADESVRAALGTLRKTGPRVDVVVADIADEEDVRAMLDGVRLSGVIHAAGVLRDAALASQNRSTFEEVLAPKVLGAWHLDRLTGDMPLAGFVLFSSSASLLGNRGQANHAAANAFLDELARDRRARGLPGISINWGPWSRIGAAALDGDRLDARLADSGLGWIQPEQGLAALEQILASNMPQVGVVPVDWAAFGRQFGGGQIPSTIRGLVPTSSSAPPTHRVDLAQRVADAPAAERESVFAEYVAEQVMRVLRLDGPPHRDTGFFDAGMDSLMAIELRNRLCRDLDMPRPLPATVVFDYPSVDALAAFLARELVPMTAPETDVDILSRLFAEVDEADLDQFSQSEFDAVIEEALRTIGEVR
jgi:NAD(P)-dependent dehydrogenase (short-subunit alcohol dehydrogenase family)